MLHASMLNPALNGNVASYHAGNGTNGFSVANNYLLQQQQQQQSQQHHNMLLTSYHADMNMHDGGRMHHGEVGYYNGAGFGGNGYPTNGGYTNRAPSVAAFSSENSTLKQIEMTIKENLKQFENARKFCAYCGAKEGETKQEAESNDGQKVLLGRCYGCQMVYYCSQKHQHLDWLENHMPKCAELEWVALGELIQSIPANPALTSLGMYWPEKFLHNINSWADWFDIRPDIVKVARQTAKIFEQNFLSNDGTKPSIYGCNQTNRKEPSYNDLVDGLLADVTDSMTYSLTIGNALIKLNINPASKPICIHLLNPPTELVEELTTLYRQNEENIMMNGMQAIDQYDIDNTVKKRFYELCNMFPMNKGFEIVFISASTILDTVNLNKTTPAASSSSASVVIDWAKMLQPPFMKTQLQKSLPIAHKNLYISAWQGTYSNYIKYACQIEGYAHPDLVVSFHPGFTSSPHKLITDWTDDLKIILMNNYPCLFTFYDKDEKQKAYNALNAFETNITCLESNQFSSLMLKQMANKPNHVYASNSFLMIIRGFATTHETDARYLTSAQSHSLKTAHDAASCTPLAAAGFTTPAFEPLSPPSVGVDAMSKHRSKSIHDLITANCANDYTNNYNGQPSRSAHLNDVSIQTLGLEDPENASLRHINGKLQLAKSSGLASGLFNAGQGSRILKRSEEKPLGPMDDFGMQLNSTNGLKSLQHQQQQSYHHQNNLLINTQSSKPAQNLPVFEMDYPGLKANNQMNHQIKNPMPIYPQQQQQQQQQLDSNLSMFNGGNYSKSLSGMMMANHNSGMSEMFQTQNGAFPGLGATTSVHQTSHHQESYSAMFQQAPFGLTPASAAAAQSSSHLLIQQNYNQNMMQKSRTQSSLSQQQQQQQQQPPPFQLVNKVEHKAATPQVPANSSLITMLNGYYNSGGGEEGSGLPPGLAQLSSLSPRSLASYLSQSEELNNLKHQQHQQQQQQQQVQPQPQSRFYQPKMLVNPSPKSATSQNVTSPSTNQSNTISLSENGQIIQLQLELKQQAANVVAEESQQANQSEQLNQIQTRPRKSSLPSTKMMAGANKLSLTTEASLQQFNSATTAAETLKTTNGASGKSSQNDVSLSLSVSLSSSSASSFTQQQQQQQMQPVQVETAPQPPVPFTRPRVNNVSVLEPPRLLAAEESSTTFSPKKEAPPPPEPSARSTAAVPPLTKSKEVAHEPEVISPPSRKEQAIHEAAVRTRPVSDLVVQNGHDDNQAGEEMNGPSAKPRQTNKQPAVASTTTLSDEAKNPESLVKSSTSGSLIGSGNASSSASSFTSSMTSSSITETASSKNAPASSSSDLDQPASLRSDEAGAAKIKDETRCPLPKPRSVHRFDDDSSELTDSDANSCEARESAATVVPKKEPTLAEKKTLEPAPAVNKSGKITENVKSERSAFRKVEEIKHENKTAASAEKARSPAPKQVTSVSSLKSAFSQVVASHESDPSDQQNNAGYVNQMKNMFEQASSGGGSQSSASLTPPQQGSISLKSKSSPTSSSASSSKNYSNEPAERDTMSAPVVEDHEYINVSSKYLMLLNLNGFKPEPVEHQSSKPMSPPESTPPPPVPEVPPPPRTPSPVDKHTRHVTTNDNLVSKVIGGQAKSSSAGLVDLAAKPLALASHNSRLMSTTSSSHTSQSIKTNTTPSVSSFGQSRPSEFRLMKVQQSNNVVAGGSYNSDRSTTPSGKSSTSLTRQPAQTAPSEQVQQLSNTSMIINNNNKLMIKQLPDAVDEVKLEYEGQRRVFVQGYLTSADILRNMLLKSTDPVGAAAAAAAKPAPANPVIVQRQQMTLKEKLLLQQQNEALGIQTPAMNNNYQDYYQPEPNYVSIEQESRMQQRPPAQNSQSTVYQQQQQQPLYSQVNPNGPSYQANAARQDRARQPSPPPLPPSLSQSAKTVEPMAPPQLAQGPKRSIDNERLINEKIAPKSKAAIDDDDDELEKKFGRRNRTRSMSGVMTFDINATTTHIIDIDIDVEPEKSAKKSTTTTTAELNRAIERDFQSQSIQSSTPKLPCKLPLSSVQIMNDPNCQKLPSKQPPPPPFAVASQAKPAEVVVASTAGQTQQSRAQFAPSQQQHQVEMAKTTQANLLARSEASTPTSSFTRLTDSARNNSKRLFNQQQQVTGSFDPNDFDSFDESDEPSGHVFSSRSNNSYMRHQMKLTQQAAPHVQIESIDRIREKAIQEQNLMQFDPEDFDSFNEDELDEVVAPKSVQQHHQNQQEVVNLPVIQLSYNAQNGGGEMAAPIENGKSEFLKNKMKLEAMFTKNQYEPSPIPKQTSPPHNHNHHQYGQPGGHHAAARSLANPGDEYDDDQQQQQSTSPSKPTKANKFIRSALDRISTGRMNSRGRNKTRKSKEQHSEGEEESGAHTRSLSVPPPPSSNDYESGAHHEVDVNEQNELDVSKSKKRVQPTSGAKAADKTCTLPSKLVSQQQPASTGGSGLIANMKTLHLMTKMQHEFEEKQKRRKMRREQKLQEQKRLHEAELSKSNADIKTSSMTPKTERKFLSSIMNTLFSSVTAVNAPPDGGAASANDASAGFQKNAPKRTSLRKLKAKDKAKKSADDEDQYQSDTGSARVPSSANATPTGMKRSQSSYEDYQSDGEAQRRTQSVSHQLPHIEEPKYGKMSEMLSETPPQPQLQQQQQQPSANARFGKIRNELTPSSDPNASDCNKENLMKQLKAELDEEIKDRRMIELKNNIINGTALDSGESHSDASNSSELAPRKSRRGGDTADKMDNANRKIRSKSVTFLDEISADEEVVATMMPSTSSYFNGIDAPYQQEPMSSGGQAYLPAPVARQPAAYQHYHADDYSANMPKISLAHEHQQQQLQHYPSRLANNGYDYDMMMNQNDQYVDGYMDYDQRQQYQQYQRNGMANSGPIKGIMKKSVTDLSITLTNPAPVPMIRNRGGTTSNCALEPMPTQPVNHGYYEHQSNGHAGSNNYNYRSNGYEQQHDARQNYDARQTYVRGNRRANGGAIQSDL